MKILIETVAAPPAGPGLLDYLNAVLNAVPALVFAVLAALVVARLLPGLPAIVARLSGVEAFGVKLSLAGGAAMTAAIEMAAKHANWQVSIPEADRSKALARAEASRALLDGAEILWVDDRPSNNRNEARMLRSFGALITCAATSEEALDVLTAMPPQRQFDLVISDISRDLPVPTPQAGIAMLAGFGAARIRLPVIFYVGVYDPARGTPPGAAGITNRPDELLMLVIDALARAR